MSTEKREDLVERLIAGMATAAAVAVANGRWAREEHRRVDEALDLLEQVAEWAGNVEEPQMPTHLARGIAQLLGRLRPLGDTPQTVEPAEAASSHNQHGGYSVTARPRVRQLTKAEALQWVANEPRGGGRRDAEREATRLGATAEEIKAAHASRRDRDGGAA